MNSVNESALVSSTSTDPHLTLTPTKQEHHQSYDTNLTVTQAAHIRLGVSYAMIWVGLHAPVGR